MGHGALRRRSRLIETLMDWSDQKRGPKTRCVCYCAHGGGIAALWYASVPRRVVVEGSRLQRERGQPDFHHACNLPICVHPE